MTLKNRTVLIIGAGPAGLSAAYCLAKRGISATVLEASPHLGGLARSFKLWGQTVDLGPHRFLSTDRQVLQLWSEVLQDKYSWVNRLTRIYYRQKYFRYPLEAWDALSKLGLVETGRSLWSYFCALWRRKKDHTFEDWVVSRFGRRLFELFFKSYTEKLWGIPCDQIDSDWAAQRIKKFSLLEAVKEALLKNRKNKHPTLADRFSYPKGGSGAFYARLAEKTEALGGTIRLKAPIRKVLSEIAPNGRRVLGVELEGGEQLFADIVVSSMPLTQMVESLGDPPEEVRAACRALKFRNTILVYFEFGDEFIFPDNWIYIHSPDVSHGRITNFRNWCPSLNEGSRTTILCMEFWCYDGDEIWKASEDQIRAKAIREIRTLNLLSDQTQPINTHIVKIKRSYPVYERGYQRHLSVVQKYVDETENLIAIGRYGSFKYNNQDHSILMGILAAQECAEKKRIRSHWEINTDSEYQEAARTKSLDRR